MHYCMLSYLIKAVIKTIQEPRFMKQIWTGAGLIPINRGHCYSSLLVETQIWTKNQLLFGLHLVVKQMDYSIHLVANKHRKEYRQCTAYPGATDMRLNSPLILLRRKSSLPHCSIVRKIIIQNNNTVHN